MSDKSLNAFREFLNWEEDKGLVPLTTIRSRKASIKKIAAVLNEQETSDVTTIDVDDVMYRFTNLKGKDYSPGSLQTYKSRLSSALDDFLRYLENPMSFKPNSKRRTTTTSDNSSGVTSTKSKNKSQPKPTPSSSETPTSHGGWRNLNTPPSAGVIPIPVRSDLTVQIHGIPFDLKRSEAQRIANVILALAVEEPD